MELNGYAPIKTRKSSGPLANWVYTQRSNYRKHLKGQPPTLAEERVKRLNSIGFKWYTSFMRALRKPNRSNIKQDSCWHLS
jgi:hypothetical protein